jgi:hypothetical protein
MGNWRSPEIENPRIPFNKPARETSEKLFDKGYWLRIFANEGP